MVPEPLREPETAGCIDCFIYGEYLIATGAPNAHCRYYYRLMPKPIAHYHRT